MKEKRHDIDRVVDYITKRFKEIYRYEEKDKQCLFYLPDGCTMKSVPLRWGTEFSLVMNYISPDDNDDGDQYWLDDYSSVDDMFDAMLEETKRPID